MFHTKKEKISALRTLFKNKFTLYGYFLVVVVGVVNAGAERVLLSPAVGAPADVFLVLALSLPAGTTSVARADTAASAAALAATLFAAAAVAGARVRARAAARVIATIAPGGTAVTVVTVVTTATIARPTLRTMVIRTLLGPVTRTSSRATMVIVARSTVTARRGDHFLDITAAPSGLLSSVRATTMRHGVFF